MKIYHYTTIETLALILKHRTIRFNRLDRVDDLEESQYGISEKDIKLGQYCFASCWTKSSEENIGLWGLYTKYKGVRIGLDERMFQTYDFGNNFYSYFPHFKIIKDSIFWGCNNEVKLIDINYDIDDYPTKIKEIGEYKEDSTIGKMSLKYSSEYGTFKRKHWQFQEESRFIISALPIIDFDLESYKGRENELLLEATNSHSSCLTDNKPISTEFLDIDLKQDAFQSMEILLGPLTNEADKIIVDSLIKKYCQNAILKDSFFRGKIREKK